MDTREIDQILAGQRRYFLSGATLPVDFRVAMLKKLRDAVRAREAAGRFRGAAAACAVAGRPRETAGGCLVKARRKLAGRGAKGRRKGPSLDGIHIHIN